MKPTKVLVVYSSREGQTARIARRIGDVASTLDGVTVRVESVKEIDENDVALADVFVVAGSVHFGRHERSLLEFVREHLSVIASRSSAFVSISGSMAQFGGRETAQGYAETFLEAAGWNPDRTELFAGAIVFTKYNFLLRWVMRRIASSHGLDTDTSHDYEYTDWDAVETFAREFITLERKAA